MRTILFVVFLLLMTERSYSNDSLMVPVAGGTFTAGTTLTTISNFKIDRYEVTFELWTTVRNWASIHGYDDLFEGRNGDNPIGGNNPVSNVCWYDAVKWCNARSELEGLVPVYYTDSTRTTVYRVDDELTDDEEVRDYCQTPDCVNWSANGYRLPTEAEWEYAAKGGTRAATTPNIYSGGNSINLVAWYADNSGKSTHTVGTKAPNELGIFDMSGNVAEWCWDWFDLMEIFPSGGTNDPKGPSTIQRNRVLRGGSFCFFEGYCRVSDRNYGGESPWERESGGGRGFRCVRR